VNVLGPQYAVEGRHDRDRSSSLRKAGYITYCLAAKGEYYLMLYLRFVPAADAEDVLVLSVVREHMGKPGYDEGTFQ
jgi:hypothetical protein